MKLVRSISRCGVLLRESNWIFGVMKQREKLYPLWENNPNEFISRVDIRSSYEKKSNHG